MIRTYVLLLVGLSIGLCAGGCQKNQTPKRAAIRPEPRKIVSTIKVVGTLKPIGLAEIHAPADGPIERVLVRKGDRVKQGDVLLIVAKDEPERSVREAQVKLRIATQRLADLQAAGPDHKAAADVAAGEKELASIALEREQERLAKCSVKARQDGVIQKLDVSEGQVVTGPNSFGPGLVLVEMAESGSFDVEFELNEVDVAKIAADQPAQITLDAVPGLTVTGRVVSIGVPDKNSFRKGMFPVTVRFATISSAVKMGMTANVTIPAGEIDAPVTIPVEYVYYNDVQPCVDVLVNNQVSRHTVELGPDDGQYVAIQSGLAVDEPVIFTEHN